MDRIKKALEKAREERDAGEVATAEPKARPAAPRDDGKPPISNTAIAYSETRILKLDQAHLNNMKVIFGDADREGLTAYKMLRTQVLQRMSAKSWNALAITSPAAEDGKTITTINLAISLARELHHTVLLVDLDMRNPTIHKFFGFEPEKGIADYLLKGTPMQELLVNPGIERLVLLPGKTPVDNSSEILASPAMGALVDELKSRYPSRLILFDLPPVLAADDALSFAPYVDAFLLVLRDAKTTESDVERAVELLSGAPILGTVLNASDEKISTYY